MKTQNDLLQKIISDDLPLEKLTDMITLAFNNASYQTFIKLLTNTPELAKQFLKFHINLYWTKNCLDQNILIQAVLTAITTYDNFKEICSKDDINNSLKSFVIKNPKFYENIINDNDLKLSFQNIDTLYSIAPLSKYNKVKPKPQQPKEKIKIDTDIYEFI